MGEEKGLVAAILKRAVAHTLPQLGTRHRHRRCAPPVREWSEGAKMENGETHKPGKMYIYRSSVFVCSFV